MKKEKRKYSSIGNQYYIYKDLWRYDKSTIFFAVIEAILQVIEGFIIVLLPAMVVKLLEAKVNLNVMIIKIMSIFILFGILSALSTYFVRRNKMQYIRYRCGYVMRKICKKILSVDYVQYEDETNQKLMSSAMEATGGNNWGLEGILHLNVLVVTEFIGLMLYAVIISNIHYLILVMLLFISMIQIICYHFANEYELNSRERKAKLEVTKQYLDRQAYDVTVGKDIRLYQLQGWLSRKYKAANKKYQAIIAKERIRYFANDLIGLVLQFIREGVCYYYLISLLKNGMDVSSFIMYIGLITSFSVYLNEITTNVMEIERFQKYVDYLRQYLGISTIFYHGNGKKLKKEDSTFEIEFSHVSFSYPKTDKKKEEKKILDDISFTMKKGEKLALVGINGAGKSTIVKLICGFYHPSEGHIYVNGIDIEEIDLDDYYQYLAVVFQEAFTHSFTIEENVSCRNLDESNHEKCINALKNSGVWDKIDTLSKKEKTCLHKDIEKDGIQLSGGQLQKLMLARALYKDCKLLLLDEPTAALDAIAEHEMYQKYDKVIAGKTALFISHRLASTRFCDKILFLENGKIVEEGSHEDLIKNGGGYSHMFEVQSQYYREEGEVNEGQVVME